MCVESRVLSPGDSAIVIHVSDKLREVLEKLRHTGIELRLVERDETPLIWAVSEGYHDIAITLIEAGADLNAQNSDGNTALLRAACQGRAELASVLIKVGAGLDIQNHDGYSALILAQRRGHREIVESLLHAGSNTKLLTTLNTTFADPGHSPSHSLVGPRDPALESQIIDAVTQCRDGRMAGRVLEKYINLVPDGGFGFEPLRLTVKSSSTPRSSIVTARSLEYRPVRLTLGHRAPH
jgi:hypothetical protein